MSLSDGPRYTERGEVQRQRRMFKRDPTFHPVRILFGINKKKRISSVRTQQITGYPL